MRRFNDPQRRGEILAWRAREGLDATVELWTGSGWTEVGRIRVTGPQAFRRLAIPLPRKLPRGEPLCRFELLLALVRRAAPLCDAWIISTSGQGLDHARARALGRAGLCGVILSLDHHVPAEHDASRGKAGAFDQALAAAAAAREAGLLLALSLCPLAGRLGPVDHWRYAELARELGAAFIQLVEPRPSGRLGPAEARLSRRQLTDLANFFWEANQDPRHRQLPLVEYPALVARATGCPAARGHQAYVDSSGRLLPCPFAPADGPPVLALDPAKLSAALAAARCGRCAAAPGQASP